MGDKEFHQMLGRLIDTKGTTKTAELMNPKGTEVAENAKEEIKRIASDEGIQLDEKDITDLVNCIKELHKIKGSDFARSPRN